MVSAMLKDRLHGQQLAFLFAKILLDGGATQSLLRMSVGVFEDDQHVGIISIGELDIYGTYSAPKKYVGKRSTLSVDELHFKAVFGHSKLSLFNLEKLGYFVC